MKPVRLFYALLRVLALIGLTAGLTLPAYGMAPVALAAPASAPVLKAEPLVQPAAQVAAPASVMLTSMVTTTVTTTVTATVTCTTTYTVKAGDNLFRIGLAHGVKWPDIAQANNLTNPGLIYVGQKLCIPAAATVPAAPPAVPVTATVPTGIPTIQITSVVADKSVTLQAAGFPANQKIDVRMGKNGTLGQGGTLVTTIDSGTGSFTGTYTIPAELKGQEVIAIRLECRWGGYFSYNWFYNSSTK